MQSNWKNKQMFKMNWSPEMDYFPSAREANFPAASISHS